MKRADGLRENHLLVQESAFNIWHHFMSFVVCTQKFSFFLDMCIYYFLISYVMFHSIVTYIRLRAYGRDERYKLSRNMELMSKFLLVINSKKIDLIISCIG